MKLFFLLSLLASASAVPVVVFPRQSATTAIASYLNVATSETKTKAPVFDEVCETTGVTLKRFMTEVAMLNPELTELTTLFGAIDTACKAITNLVKRSQLPSSETLGYEGNVNVQGEDQKVRLCLVLVHCVYVLHSFAVLLQWIACQIFLLPTHC